MENSWPTAGPSNNEAAGSGNNSPRYLSKELEADIEAFLNDPTTTDIDTYIKTTYVSITNVNKKVNPGKAALEWSKSELAKLEKTDDEKALDQFFAEEHLHRAPPSPPKDLSHITFNTEVLGNVGVRPFPIMFSNIFTSGLRGYVHYEAKPPADTMAQFFTVLTGETVRTDAVVSAWFSATNDTLRNSDMIPLFNNLLTPYGFTQDANDGSYPPLVAAALRTRAFQRNLAIHAPKYDIELPHPDTMNTLHLSFLEKAPFAFFTEMYMDLFVTMCPNLQFIVIPEAWKGNHLMTPGVLEKWAKEHKWERENKVVEEGKWVVIGKKGGWDAKQAGEWFKLIEKNMQKYG